MISYYLRLALKSLRRTPGLTALMVSAIGLGIATCIVTLTVYHAMSGNPIWWKNNVLYAVTMDSWGPRHPYDSDHPKLAPPQLTYQDATYLMQSDIPKRKAMMTQLLGMVIRRPRSDGPTARVHARDERRLLPACSTYRSNTAAAGAPRRTSGPQPVIVLSQKVNDRLFGGSDSVGRTILWNGRRFRVVGVMGAWHPLPRFYDLIDGAFKPPADTFVPFGWVRAMRLLPAGNTDSWGSGQDRRLSTSCSTRTPSGPRCGSSCPPPRAARGIRRTWTRTGPRSGSTGRFQRPRNNHLTRVGRWLQINGVVTSDSRILLRVAFAFLVVCLINTVGILLTKFVRGAPVTGVRRALGASRQQIFLQHIVEVAVVSLSGGLLGLALGAGGLGAVRALYSGNEAYGLLAHFDPLGVLWALALAALSTLAAGLYPAWVVGRLPPALYLKTR